VKELSEKCDDDITARFKGVARFYKRSKNFISQFLIVFIIFGLVLITSSLKPSIINWVFQAIMAVLLMFYMMGDNRVIRANNSIKVLRFLKLYSALVLIALVAYRLITNPKVYANQV
jgi:hypothetical protein